MVVIIGHAITAVTIFYDHEEDHKYHDYQGPQGFLLCCLRLVMFLAFLIGICQRKPLSSNDIQKAKEAHYFRIIGSAGSVYLLSLPFVVYFTNYALDNLSQQKFIVFGSFACQLYAIFVLYFQFTTKHSAYYEISYKASTFLPGKQS
jgi:hypothetical protein